MVGGKGGGATPQAQPQRAPNVMQSAAQGVQGALGGAYQGMNYNPMFIDPKQFSGSGGAYNYAGGGGSGGNSPDYNINAQQVTAGQLDGRDLSGYFNPYETQVIDQSMGDIDRARMMQANQLDAQATAGGAFGGSRQALMQAELGRNTLEQQARTSSGLRQAGYQNAQQMGLQDIGNTLQADLANQNASLGADTAVLNAQSGAYQAQMNRDAAGASAGASLANNSANLALQAQLANQRAHMGGAEFRLGAANQLGSTANLGFGMGQQTQNSMMQAGNQQQALQQQLMNAAQQQYQGYTGQPAQGLGYMSQALGAAQSGSSTTQTKQPGMFDYLTLLAS